MAGREPMRGKCRTNVRCWNKTGEFRTGSTNGTNGVPVISICSYRAIVLRALPNLEILDNVGVTQEELNDALKAGAAQQRQEDVYEDAYSNGPSQQQQQQAYQQQSPNREVSIYRTPPRPNHHRFHLLITSFISTSHQNKTNTNTYMQ